MAVFSGPTGNFRNGYQSKARYRSSISETPDVHLRLHYLEEIRRVYFMRVSAQLVFVTGIKQRPLPQLVTGHMKRLFSGLTWNFGNGHETEPVIVKLTSEVHSVNRRLHCLDEMRRICFYARLLSLY
jgi:hypothetical protein